MSCGEFERFIDEEASEARMRAHAESCASCRRRLLLIGSLRDLPAVTPPPGMDERIRRAARDVRMRTFAPVLLRLAAAILLFAGAATAILVGPQGEGEYRPRHLSVVEGGGSGASDEELVIEEVYGPEAPILTAGGGGRDAMRRR